LKAWRVSEVEAFRQWEADEDAEVDLLAKLRGGEQTARMAAGTAFHKALEQGQSGDVLKADGYTFEIVGDHEIVLPSIRELRAYKTYTVDGEPIVITGQVDGLEGRRVDDWKTTGRFDAERYLEGYQWRLYLDIFAADIFRWGIFEMAESDDPMRWVVFASHRLEQYRYPRLAEDCQALVERFARYVRAHA
jgi:hypothetical protein